MIKNYQKIIVLSGLIAMTFNSCKKKIYGCTDINALNHSTDANTDDGSCVFNSDFTSPSKQMVFIENFNITFSNQVWYSYSPDFNYEYGDFLIVETLYDYIGTESYWTTLPFTGVGSDITIWFEYSQSYGTIYVHSTNISTGNPYSWSGNPSIAFRAILIKKNALIENPDLKNMSYEEILEVM